MVEGETHTSGTHKTQTVDAVHFESTQYIRPTFILCLAKTTISFTILLWCLWSLPSIQHGKIAFEFWSGVLCKGILSFTHSLHCDCDGVFGQFPRLQSALRKYATILTNDCGHPSFHTIVTRL